MAMLLRAASRVSRRSSWQAACAPSRGAASAPRRHARSADAAGASAGTSPGLDYFIRDARRQDRLPEELESPVLSSRLAAASAEDVFARSEPISYHIETYGCQMNVSDSEIVASILQGAGYVHSPVLEDADLILTNTCAIRDNAEQRVHSRVQYYGHLKANAPAGREAPVVGVLGCMAERLKTQLLEEHRAVDLVVGPDAYRDLPSLVSLVRGGHAPGAVSVQLSAEETYADITPVRKSSGRPDAFVSIMRGCNNLCSFCIVPFTRGRERSRTVASVIEECQRLAAEGVKEVVLLGQNVNSYHDKSTPAGHAWAEVAGQVHDGQLDADARVESEAAALAVEAGAELSAEGYLTSPGFGNTFKSRGGDGVRFAELLEHVAAAVPQVRVRFTSPHPKDFPLPLLQLIADTPNLCSSLHLPAQSGSTAVLRRMRRHYTREAFVALAKRARQVIPGVSISTDLISGFSGETEEDHSETLSLIREVKFEQAFMFHYSERARTLAARSLPDDVPSDVKLRRLREVIDTFLAVQAEAAREQVGKRHLVLVEGPAKRSPGVAAVQGRTDCNRRVVLPVSMASCRGLESVPSEELAVAVADGQVDMAQLFGAPAAGDDEQIERGQFVEVSIVQVSGKTLIGVPLRKSAMLTDFC